MSAIVDIDMKNQIATNIYETLCSDILPCIYYNMNKAITKQSQTVPAVGATSPSYEISYNCAIIFKNASDQLIIFTLGIMSNYNNNKMEVELFDEQGSFTIQIPFMFTTDLSKIIITYNTNKTFTIPAFEEIHKNTLKKQIFDVLIKSLTGVQEQLPKQNPVHISYALSNFDHDVGSDLKMPTLMISNEKFKILRYLRDLSMQPGSHLRLIPMSYLLNIPSNTNLSDESYVYDILSFAHLYTNHKKIMSTPYPLVVVPAQEGGAPKNKVKTVKNYTKSSRAIVWPPKTTKNNKKYAGIVSKSRRIWTLAKNDFVKIKDIENDQFVFYKV